MRGFKKVFVSVLLVFTFFSFLVSADLKDIKFITEQYPPYNFENNEKLEGIAVDLLDLILQEMGGGKTIEDVQLLPWARGYKMVQNEDNICLFSTTRTEEREELFKWAGPITETTIGLTAQKNKNIKIEKPEDIKKYKTAVIRDDVAQSLLNQIGVKELDGNSKNEVIIKKLESGRVDLWGYETKVAAFELKNAGVENEYEVVYTLKEGELYYAFSKSIDEDFLMKFQKALDKVKSSPKYSEILKKYQ